MQWRGFMQQTTDIKSLDDELKTGCVVAYLGFDATASSLCAGASDARLSYSARPVARSPASEPRPRLYAASRAGTSAPCCRSCCCATSSSAATSRSCWSAEARPR
eukprot:1631877-Prymnesium_polylepis.1